MTKSYQYLVEKFRADTEAHDKFLKQLRAELRGVLNMHHDNVEYLQSRLRNWERRITREVGK